MIDGFEQTLPNCDDFYPIGSIIIMEGCTFYGFEGPAYGEHVREYAGPQVIGKVRTRQKSFSGDEYKLYYGSKNEILLFPDGRN